MVDAAKRDQNHVPVVLGYADMQNIVDMARVDALNGYVLIEIQPRPDYVGVTPGEPAVRDQNHVTVMMGVTDDANLDVGMIVANPTSKLPMIDYDVIP